MSYVENKLPITVVILTRDEEDVVERAIASAVRDYAEVVVIDSFSQDRTVEVARLAGARVVQREFHGFASQRNFALRDMNRKTDWVFFLDADECISDELTAELRRDFKKYEDAGVGMLYVRRKDFFQGRWIKHASGYPTWFGRLCHANHVEVQREINEEYHCSRATARVRGHLLHYPFAKGLAHWIERHNRYSTGEAKLKAAGEKLDLRLIFSSDPGARRRTLKQIYMRLPLRPLVAFVYLYIIRGGVLDGGAGLRYASLRAFYELMISIKADELVDRSSEGRKRAVCR